MSGLSPKQHRFCEEYVKERNGAQAAINAGYAANSARVTASKLLTKANISDYVNKLLERATAKTLVTLESLTAELEEAREIAKQQEDAGELRQNTMAKAKLHGLDVNKLEAKIGTTVVIQGDAAKL